MHMTRECEIFPDGCAAARSLRSAIGWVVCAGVLAACSAGEDEIDLTADAGTHWSLIGEYCLDCHDAAQYTADIAFDTMRSDSIADHPQVWEAVIRKLRAGMMPPPGGKRPDNDEVAATVKWLEASLDEANPDPTPGHIVLHRLNRTEYANAVRDLLALDVDPEALLPLDGAESGFDNIASALTVSPSFIDQYLNAARVLSERAVGLPSPRAISVPYTFANTGQEFHVAGLPLGTRGGVSVEHYFPSDGEYRLSIGDLATGLWGFNQEHRNTLIALLDGRKFFELDIGGGEDLRRLDQIGAPAVDAINAQLKDIPFVTTAGPHKVGVTFLHRSFAESDRQLQRLIPGGGQDAVLTIAQIQIFGPLAPGGLGDTPSREAIFSCYPQTPAQTRPCAREIVARLAQRAYRGAATGADVDRLMELYDAGHGQGGFESGVRFALSGVLAHPKFLYRFEPFPAAPEGELVVALTDNELASRLAFFLWSTLPDDELLQLAAAGQLGEVGVLEQQVQRMLADPRSRTLASNFAYQWLGLGELDAIDPDPRLFADVPRNIRELFIEEARLFVDSIVRLNGSALDLLSASHTFLNEDLALHYGINDVRGKRFRRYELGDEVRWGLLGKGGVLMASSYPNRTSPVLRGQWLLENLIGTPPAAPPPDVEALVENVEGEKAAGVRERLEAHRSNSSCANCHGVIDPLGFALENFDAVGRWRTVERESRTPVDASGVLADGTAVNGPVALRQALLDRPDQFVQTLTEKLMTYGLGRTIEYSDMPTIRRIVRDAEADNYRISTLVTGIVNSRQFRMKARGP